MAVHGLPLLVQINEREIALLVCGHWAFWRKHETERCSVCEPGAEWADNFDPRPLREVVRVYRTDEKP